MNNIFLRVVFMIIASTAATLARFISRCSGRVVESDLDTGSIAKFTARGARTSAATGIFDLFGVAFNSKGELFAASTWATRSTKSPRTERKRFSLRSVSGPFALAFDSHDNFSRAISEPERSLGSHLQELSPVLLMGLAGRSDSPSIVPDSFTFPVRLMAPWLATRQTAAHDFRFRFSQTNGTRLRRGGKSLCHRTIAGRVLKIAPNGTKLLSPAA